MNDKNDLSLEKLKIHERLEVIEGYVRDGKLLRSQLNDTMQSIGIRTKNIELMIHGDSLSHDKYIRDGMNRRIDSLEEKEKDADKIKGNFLKIAIGSITLAVGAFVLWLCRLVWGAIGK